MRFVDDSKLHMINCRSCGRPHDPAAPTSSYGRGMQASYWDDAVQDSLGAAHFSGAVDVGVSDGGVPDGETAAVIAVEPNVLVCCNGAFDRAVLTGASEVGLLDLLYVIAGTSTLEAWLVAYDIDRDLLRIEIEALEATSPDRRTETGAAPATSWAMKEALGAARANAQRRMADSITIGELLIAIAGIAHDEAGAVLASHIARQRQRRRGGMRGVRVDLSRSFAPLQGPVGEHELDDREVSAEPRTNDARDGGQDDGRSLRYFDRSIALDVEEALTADAAKSDSLVSADAHVDQRQSVDWVQEELRALARQTTQKVAAGEVEPAQPASSVRRQHLASSLSTGSWSRERIAGGGGIGSAGFDDLYRPGEREPSDGWHRAPSWLSVPDDRDGSERLATRVVVPQATRDRDPIDASLRQLMIRLAEWQAEMASRLDEQDLQLEGIAGQLAGLSEDSPDDDDGEASDTDADEIGDGTEETDTVSLEVTEEPAVGEVSAAQSKPLHQAGAIVGKKGVQTAATSAATGGSGSRRYLDRAAVRSQMRRTLTKRRAVRVAALNEARAAAAQRQSRDQAPFRDQAKNEMRMAVPQQAAKASAGRPDLATKQRYKDHLSGGFPKSLPDDEEADDLDGNGPQKRFYLSLDDDIVEAPSIGPKTASRLRAHGIATVRDLLSIKAQALCARVGVRHITAERVTSWQHQARLVCTIPWLRGTHAQILVGSGYYAPHSIMTANRDALCTAILRFSTTREGQSVLRSAPPPSLGKIMGWVEQAAMAEADRAV
jgi:hypothetical protein